MTYSQFKQSFWPALETKTGYRYRSAMIYWKEVRKLWRSGAGIEEAVMGYIGEVK